MNPDQNIFLKGGEEIIREINEDHWEDQWGSCIMIIV